MWLTNKPPDIAVSTGLKYSWIYVDLSPTQLVKQKFSVSDGMFS